MTERLFMKRLFKLNVLIAIILLVASCSNHQTLEKLEHIKAVGDNEPIKALAMLDSLEVDMREESDYVKHKYDLLRIRLNDKADNIPSSDIMIKQLVDYFKKEGNILEKQEVYYYAGSVYRDLQDTPQALENFYKSIDYAIKDECDSIILRNTYSNINYLYFRVQNYKDAYDMAIKEIEISKRIRNNLVTPFMHLGATYLALDSLQQAEIAFDSAYSYIIHSGDILSQEETLIHLLNNYSELGQMEKAKACLSHITTNPLEDFVPFHCLAFAQYYESAGKKDSAIIYCKRILNEKPDIYNIYDAAKTLFRLYQASGDVMNANKYADIYMQYSDSLDFGKRQELAATVNNQYQYHLDQKKEQELKDNNERYKNYLTWACFCVIIIAFVSYIAYLKHQQKVAKISIDLQQMTDKNKAIIGMLHQSKLEEKAEDIIYDIRKASEGKKEMKPSDWKKLYQAVDELYPEFKDSLISNLGTFTEQQMQVCYLIKIGLSNPQIQNVTTISRSTIWRWVNNYSWIKAN